MKTMKMKFMRFAACTAFAAMAASAFAAGSPALERAEVRLPGGKALRIEALESATKRYVASVSLNGKTVKENWLSAADLAKGGRLVFRMSSKPVKTRGTTLAAAPYSMSKDEKNLFFVGDVKQSIYRFRLADPGLFLAKYDAFTPAERAEGDESRRILLQENFRSRGAVLDACNHVFRNIMSRALGELDYDDDAALKCGLPEMEGGEKAELHLLQMPDEIKNYRLHIYGNRSGLPTLKDSPHIVFHDFMPAEQFIESVKGEFGFVWDGDSLDSCTGNFGEYLRYNSPHKVSFYLRAGMPVIIWSEAALAGLVKEEGIGLCISSIEELNTLLKGITAEKLSAMHTRVREVSDRLRHGDYFRHALGRALSEMHFL